MMNKVFFLMANKGSKSIGTIALFALTFAGCAAPPYRLPGTEKMPLSSLATVHSGSQAAAYFVSIDGKRIPHVVLPVTRWEILPGEHEVVVGIRTTAGGRSDSIPLKFLALPGRAYVIQYETKLRFSVMGSGTWRAWIEDESGITVSTSDTGSSKK